MIYGVVLAAGRSSRMGCPKALLPIDGDVTLLSASVSALSTAGCAQVIVVTGDETDRDASSIASVARATGAITVSNPEQDAPPVSSLRVALKALPNEVDAVLMTPVDVPMRSSETAARLIAAFHTHRAPIVLPSYEGKRGHPALFSRSVFGDLMSDPLPEGARTVVGRYEADLETVDVDDDTITLDLDTPAEYHGFRGRS